MRSAHERHIVGGQVRPQVVEDNVPAPTSVVPLSEIREEQNSRRLPPDREGKGRIERRVYRRLRCAAGPRLVATAETAATQQSPTAAARYIPYAPLVRISRAAPSASVQPIGDLAVPASF
eukprot:COSAG03_NODE_1876_length_3399_cov_3.350303_2_plen_120_part_00